MNRGLCTLQYAVGRTESCPGEGCPFWEEGVEVGCAVAPIERQLIKQPALAQYLLELRADLDRARHGTGEETRRQLFYRLLNQEGGGGEAMTGRSHFGVELYWLPVGAGGHSVRLNGKVFEALASRLAHRKAQDLYHSALVATAPEGRFVIEQAPAKADRVDRGVVAEGPVGTSWAGRLRLFRYEIRRWRDGTIPDVGEAVDSPRRLSEDPDVARRVLELVAAVPTPVWGRDELHAGEMWNSNSIIAWTLTRAGLDLSLAHPPEGGRAPGWHAGVAVAARPPAAAFRQALETRAGSERQRGGASTRAAVASVAASGEHATAGVR